MYTLIVHDAVCVKLQLTDKQTRSFVPIVRCFCQGRPSYGNEARCFIEI